MRKAIAMRQFVLCGTLALTLILALPGGTAGARGRGGTRVVEAPYRTPALGVAVGTTTVAYYYDCINQIGCAIVPLERGDRFVRIEVEDAAGTPVHASLYSMPGGFHYGNFCGSTEKPISVAGKDLLVHVVSGVCPDGSTASVATTGIVKATLSRRNP